jgi:hypothetical protein
MKMAKIKILDLEVKKIVQLTSDEQYLIQGGCCCKCCKKSML